MADLFWIGGDGNWSDTTHWATTSGGLGPHAKPTAADNANFDSLSNASGYTLTFDSAAVCLSLIVGNPLTGAPTFAGSATLAISGSMTLVSGMGWTYTGTITFNATATGKTITTAGVSLLNSLTFNGTGGGWTLQDNLTSLNTATITLTRGNLNFNAKTISVGIVTYSGTQTRTFDANGATFNITGFNNTLGTPASVWVGDTTTLLTIDMTGSTITMSGRNANFRPGGKTFNNVIFTGGDANGINAAGTIANLTYTIANAGGQLNDVLNIPSGLTLTITGTFTVNGGTPQIRARIGSGIFNGVSTINAAAVSLANVDFYNTIGAGAAAPFTGTSLGDMGFNTSITFDTPRTVYWVGNSGSQSDSAHWSLSSGGAGGANMPLPQDTARVDANSVTLAGQTLTFDEPRTSALDFTGVLNNPIWAWGANPIYTGNLTLAAGMTVSGDGNFTTFQNISTASIVITSNGVTLPGRFQVVNFAVFASGNVNLADNMSVQQFAVQKGVFNDNGHNVYARDFFQSSGSVARTLTKSGTWTCGSRSDSLGAWWQFTSTGITWSDTGSTVLLASSAPTGVRTFTGAGLTYGNFTWADESSTQGLTITGANTFNAFVVAPSASARTLTMPAAVTVTFGSFTAAGTLGALLSLISSAGGTPATISDASGTNSCDYLSVKDSTAAGGAAWYAGANSIDVSGNTGWTFTAPPTPGGGGFNPITQNGTVVFGPSLITPLPNKGPAIKVKIYTGINAPYS